MVRLFKAATWEKLKTLITDQNAALSDAAKAILQSNEEYNVRNVLREREEYLRADAYRRQKIREQEEIIAKLSEDNALLRKNSTMRE